MRSPLLEIGPWRWQAEVFQIRTATHHEQAASGNLATAQGDFPERVVCCYHHVRSPKCQTFRQLNQSVKKAFPPELGLVKLRGEVVLVKDEPHAEQPEEKAD